ncbi:flippase [Bibersteinia trehalosi]|uniref:Flippase n=1 Tax=Bibersteinia trehalosi TaxID=47735 RepID=A0A3R8MLF5_BIBTR|nr:flippase [Bibersteinia trehalosi]RRN04495.1 flippase [Bibersteinia trehalosi]
MKVVKDSAIYLIGELTARSVPFLLLPYLSRKLGVEGFGQLSYFQAWLALFTIFISLSQEGAVARYFYFYGKRSLNLVLRTGYSYSFTIGILILAVCWLTQSEILAIVALSALFQSFLNVQLTVRQCRKQALSYALIQLCSTIVSAGLTVLLLEIYQDDLVEKRLLAILCSNIFVFTLAYVLYTQHVHTKRFSFQRYKIALYYLLGFGFPLILHNGSLFLRGQFDRFLINHQFSQTELGLYAMGLQIASILTIVIQVLNKALTPHLFEGLKQKKITLRDIHRWATYSLLIIPIPALVIWLIPEDIVIWILGEQFVGTKYYITLFLISSALLIPYLILVNYLFYFGKNKQISFCSVLGTICYIIALLLLSKTEVQYIPYAGILGAIIILPLLYTMTTRVSKKL